MDLEKTFGKFLAPRNLVILAAVLSIAAALLFYLLLPGFPDFELVFTFLLFTPPCLAFLYADYARERRVREIEDALPSALFQLSSFPHLAPVEKLVDSISRSDYGPLSEEFAKASRQMKSGSSVREALQGISGRSGSLLLERTVSLLLLAQEGGSNVSRALREIAEESAKLSAISREIAASAALQKYTLLAAGAFIIPGVLGALFSATSSFSSTDFFQLGLVGSASSQAELRQAIHFGTQFYLIAFSLLAAAFVSLAEGSLRKSVVYAAFLLPCSLLVFSLASHAPLLG